MAIAIIPISTLQQYFLEKHPIPNELQQHFFVSLIQDFGREDLAKAMHHLYENRSDSWIRIRPEDFEELMEYYTYAYQERNKQNLNFPQLAPDSEQQKDQNAKNTVN